MYDNKYCKLRYIFVLVDETVYQLVINFIKTVYGATIALIVFLASAAAVATFVLQAPTL